MSGNGAFSATLPITINSKNGTITIADGKLSSAGENGIRSNGVIRYNQGEVDNSATLANPTAFTAAMLSNFHYSKLDADITLEEDGKLLAKTNITGKNPNMNISRPTNVNLNVEQNLYELLKSLNAVNKLPEELTGLKNE